MQNTSNQDLSFYNGGRLFGTFHPDVVIEEVLENQADITENSVETGSTINDHVIIKPGSVRLDVCFKDMSKQGLTPNEMYNAILDSMNTCLPFDIVTTRRMYTDMLFKRIQNTTNKDNQNTLRLTLEFQHVNLVSLQQVSVKTPQNEKATTTQKGQVQAKPKADASAKAAEETAKKNENNNSLLYNIFYGDEGAAQ